MRCAEVEDVRWAFRIQFLPKSYAATQNSVARRQKSGIREKGRRRSDMSVGNVCNEGVRMARMMFAVTDFEFVLMD